MSVSSEAFQRELRQFRDFSRGDVIGTVSVRCDNETCPCGLMRVGFAEARSNGTKPLQWPLRCPRCGSELVYIGLQRGQYRTGA